MYKVVIQDGLLEGCGIAKVCSAVSARMRRGLSYVQVGRHFRIVSRGLAIAILCFAERSQLVLVLGLGWVGLSWVEVSWVEWS